MHGLIRDHLEEYLGGGPDKKRVSTEFDQHIRECETCREEVSWMQDQSQILRSLAGPKDIGPAPGFYARVLNRIEAQQNASIWSAFLDPIFGPRLVATSLTLAILLAGFVAFREVAYPPTANDDEVIMAIQEHSPALGQDRQRDRDTILVTLATYSD
ncbi:MAG: anti-sigma factor family protein [Rhodospirillales bacterium]